MLYPSQSCVEMPHGEQFPGGFVQGLHVPVDAASVITHGDPVPCRGDERRQRQSRKIACLIPFTFLLGYRYKYFTDDQFAPSIETLHSTAELMKSSPPSTQMSKSHGVQPGTNKGHTVGSQIDRTPST